MEAAFQWMKNIVYFLLLVGVIRNLISREYQKYAGLAVGLCLVLLVAAPAMEYISEDNFFYHLEWNELGENLAWEEISSGEEEWKENMLTQYCRVIKEQAGEMLKSRGVAVERVELQMEKGTVITGLSIWVSLKSPKEKQGAVETISITDIVIRINENEETKAGDLPELALLKMDIKTELADFYDMDASHINVIIL